MNLHNLGTVASYNSKLLLRSWLFRLFLLFVFCLIIVYQLLAQTTVFFGINSGLISLASNFPHQNAYLFSILQVVPLVFLAGTFLCKDRKMDSMDTVYYRPESNADYVVGMFIGFAATFTVMAGVSLLCGVLLQVFASESPFNIWIYLFYWGTMIFPGLVFALGFSFFIHTWVRHRGLSILILLVVFGFFVFKLSPIRQGLFDPFGLSIPNAFSEITGHAGMGDYLMQRACWLFVGLGFMGLSVLLFRRLANRPVNRKRVAAISAGCLLVGVVFGGILYVMQVKETSNRKGYAEIYEKYRGVPKGNVISNSIDIEQKGKGLTAKSTLVVRNQGKEVLPEIILYLNPALDVSSIKEGEDVLAFERESLVVRVARRLNPAEDVELSVEYHGGIDDRVCYLDVPDDKFYELRPVANHSCVPGKKFALLDDSFTVLTPECLWYPVARPPVNPEVAYDVIPDFSDYTLRVTRTDGRTVVSSGVQETIGDAILFTNGTALPGISLCLGNFERFGVEVDSTLYELYFLEGHDKILRGTEGFRDSIAGIIRDARYYAEERLGLAYPYNRLALVETPISFSGFVRNFRGGSGNVQPELVFFPEMGVGYWNDFQAELAHQKRMMPEGMFLNRSSEEQQRSDLVNTLSGIFVNDFSFSMNQMRVALYPLIQKFGLWGMGVSTEGNLCAISPMCYEQTFAFHSEDYPAVNAILTDALKSSLVGVVTITLSDCEESFKGRSVEDILGDREENPLMLMRLLQYKSKELVRLLCTNGVSSEQVLGFMKDYIEEHRFQRIEFEDLNRAFIEKFDLDWTKVFPAWYTNRELPLFIMKDIKVEEVVDRNKEDVTTDNRMSYDWTKRLRVSICLFNDSDVDGIFSICTRNMQFDPKNFGRGRGTQDKVTTRNFLIKARTGRQVVVVTKGVSVYWTTNISSNLPNNAFLQNRDMLTTTDTTEFVKELDRSYFMSAPGEIIVDNEDEDFLLVNPSSKKRLRELLFPSKERKYEYGTSLMLMEGSEIVPRHMVNEEAYGLGKLTHAFMLSGSGARMKWKSRIEREGEYEIYAYVPPKVEVTRMSKKDMKAGVFSYDASAQKEPLEAKQYYILENGEENYEVTADFNGQKGWVSLGRFRLPAGECKVVLTDRGMEDQVLLGDAVKWIYVGGDKVGM